MSEASETLRREFKKGDDIRDEGLTTPEDIRRFDDIQYGPDPDWEVLDVYRPKEAEGQKLPVIVNVHGGGWVYADKERYQFYCMSLAQRGFAVVNFTYRLAPEYKFPSSLEDTNMVFTWVLEHADEYNFDPDHVFAVGDSAGGNTLGLYCNFCTNPDYAANFTFAPPSGFVPTAVALNSGAYDLPCDGTAVITEDMKDLIMTLVIEDLLPDHGSAEEEDLISVTRHVTDRFPPAFLMTSTGDLLIGQVPLLQTELTALGDEFIVRLYRNEDGTPLEHVFHCNIRKAVSTLCNDEECDFFRRFL